MKSGLSLNQLKLTVWSLPGIWQLIAVRLVIQERMAIIHRLINELPEKQRLIMQLRDIEGESYKEIADVLHLTEEQVKVNLFRARQKVKQRYTEIEGYGL